MTINQSTMTTNLYTDSVNSPLGPILIKATESGLREVSFSHPMSKPRPSLLTSKVKKALTLYFQGQLRTFDFPIDWEIATEFQQHTWRALMAIPYGCSASYGEIAATINKPKASRAVGAANGKNPIAIVIPCHRVIGSQGHLTGYAGGIDKKIWLLIHEGISFKQQAGSTQTKADLKEFNT